MDADTDSDYTSDSRADLFDGVDRARAFDNESSKPTTPPHL